MKTVSVDTEPHVLSYERTRRLADLTLAGARLFFLVPLLALIALAIRLEFKGTAMFRQLRSGRNREPFRIHKFRTIQVLGTDLPRATREDNRTTRPGHWLRSSSLDELPQVVNVIAADTALVGKRPHAIAHRLFKAVSSQAMDSRSRRDLASPACLKSAAVVVRHPRSLPSGAGLSWMPATSHSRA